MTYRAGLVLWVLSAVALLLLAGCAVVNRECPETATTYREHQSRIVVWCQK